MTPIFLHLEASLYVPSKPYRLVACDVSRRVVFESNIVWDGVDAMEDEVWRSCRWGTKDVSNDGMRVVCCGHYGYVMGVFGGWLGVVGEHELWVKSVQQCWREIVGLGLLTVPIFDISTYARLGGLDFATEVGVAHRLAIGMAGTSPRCGAYELAILFDNISRKTNHFK